MDQISATKSGNNIPANSAAIIKKSIPNNSNNTSHKVSWGVTAWYDSIDPSLHDVTTCLGVPWLEKVYVDTLLNNEKTTGNVSYIVSRGVTEWYNSIDPSLHDVTTCYGVSWLEKLYVDTIQNNEKIVENFIWPFFLFFSLFFTFFFFFF